MEWTLSDSLTSFDTAAMLAWLACFAVFFFVGFWPQKR